MSSIEHPPAFRLDAHVAGDLDPRVTAHLETCEACASYVAATTSAAAAFAGAEGKRSAEFVLALEDREPAPTRSLPPVSLVSRLPRATWAIAPLLAAAAVLFVLRGGNDGPPLEPLTDTPSVRFKGKIQLAVVRDRSGDQSRIATQVEVRPNDRLRVEIAVDEARPLEVGFLGKDGTWVLLMAPALVEPGTHLSERAARFDDDPTEGWIIAGHPDDVERAKKTRSFDDVAVVPIVLGP